MPRGQYNRVFIEDGVLKKKCCTCGKIKEITEFAYQGKVRGGWHYTCKECKNQWGRERSVLRKAFGRNHPVYEAHRRKERDRTFRRRYGISLEEYEELQKKSRGLCAICGRPETMYYVKGEPAPLALDHDHETGEMRGLLCRACNQGIGNFREDPALLRKAIKYLRRYGKG